MIVRTSMLSRRARAGVIALTFVAVLLAAVLLAGSRSGSASVMHVDAAGTGQSEAVASLGTPDHIGYAVSDINAVTRQFAAATGTQFRPVEKSTATVALPEAGIVKTIKLAQALSVRGRPFIEFVKASHKVGPWAAGRDHSTVYLSYSVDDVWASGAPLRDAGMRLVAYSGSRFAFWRGAGDIVVRLVKRALVPTTSGVNEPQAAIDLGVPPLIAFSPCDPATVKSQLSAALGFGWRQTGVFVLPFELRDGTVHEAVELTAEFSVPEEPFILLETSDPTIEPFACGHVHLPFPVENIPDVDEQVQNAGMDWLARGAGGLVVYYEGLGGIHIEIFHPSLGEPPPIE